MRSSSRPSSNLFSLSVLVFSAACSDVSTTAEIDRDAIGADESALRSSRHQGPSASARRDRSRHRRYERLEALRDDALEHRNPHRSRHTDQDAPPRGEQSYPPIEDPPPAVDGGASGSVEADAGSDVAPQPIDAGQTYDAGGGEAGSGGSTGAGGTASGSGGTGGSGGQPQPPPPLPRDIVARSALPIYALEGDQRLSEDELWQRIAASPATCFGETHTSPHHHFAQLRSQAELAARAGGAVAFGFEMFERRFQASLDAFTSGAASEGQLLADTQYASRWGYDYSLYRPLVERSRDYGVTMLGLNARRELVQKVARTSVASLSADEQAEMPELVLDDPEHMEFIYGIFGVLPEHASEFGLENVYAAQTTRDEMMAEVSAAWLMSNPPDARLIVFSGSFHCHRSAIPRRITRRTGLPVLSLDVGFESELALSTDEGYDLRVVLDDVPDAVD